MRKIPGIISIAATLGLNAAPAPVTAQVAGVRQPTSPWVVDYAEDECLLDRNYGTQEQPMILAFSRVPMDPAVTVSLLMPDGNASSRYGSATLGIGAAAPVQAHYRAYPVLGKDLRYFKAYLDNGLAHGTAQTSTITIYAPGEISGSFAIPALPAALHALDQCVVDLGQTWGITAEQQKRIKSPAAPLRSDYLRLSDYPSSALEANPSWRAKVRMSVDATGKPRDCTPLKSSDGSLFAETTCKLLMERAQFSPAVDLDGKPMASMYVYTVDWKVR